MKADADYGPYSWREEKQPNEEPGDFGLVDDLSDDDDLSVVVFDKGACGVGSRSRALAAERFKFLFWWTAEVIAEACRLVNKSHVGFC